MSRDEDIEIMARALHEEERDGFGVGHWEALNANERAWYFGCATAALTALEASGRAVVQGWQPIESAPKSYHPPLSHYNHHAPDILGLWGQAFYCVCSWGGPSQPFWIDGNNQKIPFQPTHWQPLPSPPMKGQKG